MPKHKVYCHHAPDPAHPLKTKATAYDVDKVYLGGTPLGDILADKHYLKWLAQNMDMGPGHGDGMMYLQEQYTKETGKEIPEGWIYE